MKRFLKVLISGVLAIGLLSSGLAVKNATAYTVAEYGNGGFLNIDYQVQAREAMSSIGGGPNGTDSMNNFYLPRNRVSVLGMANETYGYAFQLEYAGGRKIGDTSVSTQASDYQILPVDLYLSADYGDAFKVRVGKTKHILTREVSEGCFDPLNVDRSRFVSGPFSDFNHVSQNKTTRDNGVTALGNLFTNMFQYRLGIMEGNNYSDAIKPDSVGYRYTGRVHVSLFEPEAGWGYKGSYLGKKKVLTLGAGYEMEPDAVYADSALTGAKDYTAFTYDMFLEYPTESGTFTLSSAFLKQDFDGAGSNDALGATDFAGEKNGFYWKAAYMLGKFQVFGRMEKWAFASLGGVLGQEINWTAEGINYYIKGQDLRLTLERQNIDFVKPGAQDFNTVILQFQARI